MKISLAVLTLAALISSSAFANSAINFDIQIHEVLTLKKVSSNRFEKMSSSDIGTTSLDLVTDGVTKNIIKQALNESNSVDAFSLEISGKNIVRVIDQKENINQEIQAEVNKTIFGNVKSVTIKSKTLEALYAESLKKSGLDVLRGLNVAGQINFSSDVTFSDEVCTTSGELLICNQDIHLGMSFSE